MDWYNYKAPTINTPLSGGKIMLTKYLEEFISGYQASAALYHCYYDLEKRNSFVEYSGLLRPVFDTIHLDLDSKDDLGLAAWEDTRRLYIRLQESGCPAEVYFSGSKGFHIAIHKSAFGISEGPKAEIEARVKAILFSLKETYATMDTGIWNANRKFRAYRSQHEKSGLYKIRLTNIAENVHDFLQYTLAEIRELATAQPMHNYSHPKALPEPVAWLFKPTPPSPQVTKSLTKSVVIKELPAGKISEDESNKFRSFKHKLCISEMRTVARPSVNRHDVGLRIIHDLWSQGMPVDQAKEQVLAWATLVFNEPDRISDTLRQVDDAYTKPQEYQFSCYDPIKSSHCSAKCKVYTSLDRSRRPEPLDCSERQRKENEIRRTEDEQSEGQIADGILASLGNIVTFSGDFFNWGTTHWKKIDRERLAYLIKQACIRAYENQAKYYKVESLYKQILSKIPVAPETNCFFASSPDKFNFLDGTCWVSKDEKGNISLEMKPHNPADMLSHCAPFPLYANHDLSRSGDFKHYVETRQEALGDEGMLALKQLFGAAMIPYSPRIFFLLGESNTGKSTAAIIIEQLLGSVNVSSCDPTSEYQFEWEPSIGKIANIMRELPRRPLQDAKIKDFRDKRAVGMQRKGIKGVQATVPFLHIYCCNRLPPSLEGNSGAFDNRMTILQFKPSNVNGFGTVSNLGDWLWERDAGGILDFAREGLALLIKDNFQYKRVRESSELLATWQDETDPVKLYFMEITSGERVIRAEKLPSGGILGMTIYDDFKVWAKECNFRALSHIRFYKELERCGVKNSKKMENGKVIFWDAVQLESTVC